jgi:hypothetical protein
MQEKPWACGCMFQGVPNYLGFIQNKTRLALDQFPWYVFHECRLFLKMKTSFVSLSKIGLACFDNSKYNI